MIELSTKTFAELGVDYNRAWEIMRETRDMLTIPGVTQEKMKADPVVGPQYNALVTELLTLILHNFDVNKVADDDAVIDRMSTLYKEIAMTQFHFLGSQMTQLGIAMQVIPPSELFVSLVDMNGEIDPSNEGLTQAKKMHEELKKTHGENYKSAMAAKPCDELAEILAAGQAMAGGRDAFSAIQAEVAQREIKVAEKVSPIAGMVTQIIGTIMIALDKRSMAPEMFALTARASIEAIILARQTVNAPFVAAREHGPETLTEMLGYGFTASVKQWMNDREEGDSAADAEPAVGEGVEVKATSSVFAGNGTVN